MSTAQEVRMKMEEATPRLEGIAKYVEAMTKELSTIGTCFAIGREVCARRARKLRKRKEVVQYAGRTSTGKARYRWMRVLPAWAIYRPNAELRGRPLADGPA